MRQHLPILIGAALVAGATFAAPPKTCKVPWPTAHQEGSARGFAFSVGDVAGTGSCFAHGLSFVISASNDAGVTCRVTFFEGASIREGWKVLVIAESEAPFAQKAAPGLAPLVATIAAPSGRTLVFAPKQMEFAGPSDCIDWLDALHTGSPS